MTTRIIATPVIKTEAELERIVRQTVQIQLTRETKVAARDKELEQISARHNKSIDELAVRMETNLAHIEQWSESHRDRFGKDKSILVDGHRIGWRTSPPAARTKKKFTWARVLEVLSGMSDEVKALFIRTKIEPDKAAMVAHRDQPELLASFGVEITQAETFFLDPDRQGQDEPTLTKSAAQ